jgi:hypothetical protein
MDKIKYHYRIGYFRLFIHCSIRVMSCYGTWTHEAQQLHGPVDAQQHHFSGANKLGSVPSG